MYVTVLTWVHVLISLVAIATGCVVLAGLLTSRRLNRLTAVFLATTVLTSATGFLFPLRGITPAVVFGVLSLLILAVALYARYGRRMAGRWKSIYVVTSMTALYLNVFVLVVQAFLKVPGLKSLAPTQTEAPFAEAQGAAFVAFATLTLLAALRFRATPAVAVAS